MDTVAAAQQFLEGLASETNGAAAGLASEVPASDQPPAPSQDQNGSVAASVEESIPAADGTTSARRKRNRWGPAPTEDGKKEGDSESKPPEKKRRSRWEDVPEVSTDTTLSLVPKEIVIAGGIKVGDPASQLFFEAFKIKLSTWFKEKLIYSLQAGNVLCTRIFIINAGRSSELVSIAPVAGVSSVCTGWGAVFCRSPGAEVA